MNCDEARFALAAEPSGDAAAVLAHLEQCPSCVAYRADMLELDRRLHEAMLVSVPEVALPAGPFAVAAASEPRRGLPSGHRLTRRFALAASIGGVAVLAGLLWGGFPRASLASDVVAHMAHERTAWETTTALPATDVEQVLDRSGARLAAGFADVTYARSCWFRGHWVPHLVVRTADGPVTLLVLRHESVPGATSFDESGYRGTLVPADGGSIAVLSRDAADVEAVAARAVAALAYGD